MKATPPPGRPVESKSLKSRFQSSEFFFFFLISSDWECCFEVTRLGAPLSSLSRMPFYAWAAERSSVLGEGPGHWLRALFAITQFGLIGRRLSMHWDLLQGRIKQVWRQIKVMWTLVKSFNLSEIQMINFFKGTGTNDLRRSSDLKPHDDLPHSYKSVRAMRRVKCMNIFYKFQIHQIYISVPVYIKTLFLITP